MKTTIQTPEPQNKLVTVKDFPVGVLGRINKWPSSSNVGAVITKIKSGRHLVKLDDFDYWDLPVPFDFDINLAAIEILPSGTQVILMQD